MIKIGRKKGQVGRVNEESWLESWCPSGGPSWSGWTGGYCGRGLIGEAPNSHSREARKGTYLSSVGCAVSLSFCSEWGLAGHGSCHPAIKRSHRLPFKHAKILQIPYVLDGPRGHHAKWNKSEKDKYWMISLICGIHKSWTQKHRVAWWLLGAGVGNQVGAGHRVPISSSEMSKSGGPNIERAD